MISKYVLAVFMFMLVNLKLQLNLDECSSRRVVYFSQFDVFPLDRKRGFTGKKSKTPKLRVRGHLWPF